jgi:methionyl-tRNA synthetase
MVQRYHAGVVPRDVCDFATPLDADARRHLAAYAEAMDAMALERGAATLIELATRANRYVEETAPWKLAKEGRDAELATVLANLIRTVGRLAVLAVPFMPAKARLLWEALGSGRPLASVRYADVEGLNPSGWVVQKPPPLFPKPAPHA